MDLRVVRVAAADGPLFCILLPTGVFAQAWRIPQGMFSACRTISSLSPFPLNSEIIRRIASRDSERRPVTAPEELFRRLTPLQHPRRNASYGAIIRQLRPIGNHPRLSALILGPAGGLTPSTLICGTARGARCSSVDFTTWERCGHMSGLLVRS